MSKNIKLLIVVDDFSIRDSLYKSLSEEGYQVDTAETAAISLKKMQENIYDLVILDITIPGMDGIELQKRIQLTDRNIAVIIITSSASVETAVQSFKAGAYDYIVIPFDHSHIIQIVNNALRDKKLSIENIQLREHIIELSSFDEIIGESSVMKNVFNLVETMAKTDTTVLIKGETGTGKELIARAIHSNSSRRYFPFITANCGGLPEGILESELFGHERGAFYGAQYRRKGKFEIADGGTIFLDEISNLSSKIQTDLLQFLESKQFSRIGGNEILTSNFRIISSTNSDLEAVVKSGIFREDLYYKLNVFSIIIPPLRERKSDIPLLAQHFLKKYSVVLKKPIDSFSPDALDLLVKYNWPGNIRELENAIERAMMIGKPPVISPENLPIQISETKDAPASETLADVEKNHIIYILDKTGWNISRSAEILGIDRVTLYNKIEKYGLR